MKLFVILSIIALSKGDQQRRSYIPSTHAHADSIVETPILGRIVVPHVDETPQQVQYVQIGEHGTEYTHDARPERPQAVYERNAKILQQDYEREGDSYSYAYETENGIYAEETGAASHGVVAHGGYSYTGDDGKQYTIRYTADEHGFKPQGDHLPTPPPIPKEILESLEQNAREEAAGIFNDGEYDGSYDPKIYETSGKAAYDVNYVHHINELRNAEIADNDEDSIVTHAAATSEDGVQAPRQYVVYDTQNIAQRKVDTPPQNQKVQVLEDRSSNGHFEFRKSRPNHNIKNGYKY